MIHEQGEDINKYLLYSIQEFAVAKKKNLEVSPVPAVPAAVEPDPQRALVHGEKSQAIVKALEAMGFPGTKVSNADVVEHVRSAFGIEVTVPLVAVKKTAMKKGRTQTPQPSPEPTVSDLMAFKRKLASEGLDIQDLRRKLEELEELAAGVGGFERLRKILEAYEVLLG